MASVEGTEEPLYIQTTTQSYVSRKAVVDGSKQVEIKGQSVLHDGARIRGDLGVIRIGRYVQIGANSCVQPPVMPLQQEEKYVPIQIGSYTVIGRDCQLEAASIGSLCSIGDNVKAGERCILKDCCVVAERTTIPADMVLPPFTFLSVVNGRLSMTELPPAVAVELQEQAMERYQEFVATERAKR